MEKRPARYPSYRIKVYHPDDYSLGVYNDYPAFRHQTKMARLPYSDGRGHYVIYGAGNTADEAIKDARDQLYVWFPNVERNYDEDMILETLDWYEGEEGY